jgi:hypothetical protein
MSAFKPLMVLTLMLLIVSQSQCSSLSVSPIGKGKSDDSGVIQLILNKCAASHGGIVTLPAGKYRLDKPIRIPSGVTLKGEWPGPHHTMIDKGTVILAYAGKGKENAPPLIKLNANSAIDGVTIYYPEQKLPDPYPYPWTIQGEGADCSMMNVTLVNPYNAVDFQTFTNERHYIRNVFGCILRKGIFVDRSANGRIENVHFSSNYWARAFPNYQDSYWNPLFPEQYLNLEAFRFGKADNECVTNTFAIPCKIGYHFVKSKYGACSGIFSGIGMDHTQQPILIDETSDTGILITNAEIVAGNDIHTEAHIEVTSGFTGVAQFNSCSFWGFGQNIARIHGSGTISMVNCNMPLYTWDVPSGKPAFEVNGGSFSLINCTLFAGWDRIVLGKDVQSAVIVGNTARGSFAVDNLSNGDVQIVGNAPNKR